MNAFSALPAPLPNNGIVELGGLTLDLEMRTLRRSGETVSIGSRAFDILVALALAEGRLVTKDELMNAVWPSTVVEENNIQVHLSSLRRILGADRDLIITVPGRGYQLVQRHIRTSRMRANSLASVGRLPGASASLTGLIGREADLERVLALLRKTPLLTIVGAGGIGKSSLAVEAARRFSIEREQQSWLVGLASLTQRVSVIEAIAESFGFTSDADTRSLARLTALIGQSHGLLLIDNAEHLIVDVAEIAHELTASCPHMRILVTSREALRTSAEMVYRLEPLATPALHATASESSSSPAVKLFIGRARALHVPLQDETCPLPVIGEICRRLDGNPLAIELAATRLAVLSLEDIRLRLGDQLAILAGGFRTALPRHRSFRATLDWSYDLLEDDQQAVFRRISVFSTPFEFSAMCAVSCDTRISVEQAIDCASELVAKSLLNVCFVGPVALYRTAESARLYGREKLAEAREWHRTWAHHAHYASEQLARAESAQGDFLPVIEDVLTEARAALAWSFAHDGDQRVGVELSAALATTLFDNGSIKDCCECASSALAVLASLPPETVSNAVKTRLMASLTSALPHVGADMSRVEANWKSVLDDATHAGDKDMQFRALFGLWDTMISQGRVGESEVMAMKFRLLAGPNGTEWQSTLGNLLSAVSSHCLGRHDEAHDTLAEGIQKLMRIGAHFSHSKRIPIDPFVLATGTLARTYWLQGKSVEAMSLVDALVDRVLPQTVEPTFPHVLGTVAIPLALMTGDVSKASKYLGLMKSHAHTNALTHWIDYADALQGYFDLLTQGSTSTVDQLENALERLFSRGYRRLLTPLAVACAEARAQSGKTVEARHMLAVLLDTSEREREMIFLPEILRGMASVEYIGIHDGRSTADSAGQPLQTIERAIELAQAQGAHELAARARATREKIFAIGIRQLPSPSPDGKI